MNVKFRLDLDEFEFELTDSLVVEALLRQKKIEVTLLDHFGRLYEGDLERLPESDEIMVRDLQPGNIYIDVENNRLAIPYASMKKMDRHYIYIAKAVDVPGFVTFLKTADQEVYFRWKR